MDRPWEKPIRDKKQLTYFDDTNCGQWAGVLKKGVEFFNEMAKGAVRYVESNDRESVNVFVGISTGNASFIYGGDDRPIVFAKTSTHGITRTFAYDTGIAKAAIFLPSEPSQNDLNVLQFIAIHELVHACGLEGHDSDGVLMTAPNIQSGKLFSTPRSRKMPPFFLSPQTIGRLKTVW